MYDTVYKPLIFYVPTAIQSLFYTVKSLQSKEDKGLHLFIVAALCVSYSTLCSMPPSFSMLKKLAGCILVLSKNVDAEEYDFKRVAKIYENDTVIFIKLQIGVEIIRTTPSHLFYTIKDGWKKAVNLKAGDKIATAEGSEQEVNLVELQQLEKPERIYNLNVEDYYTYFVSSQGLLVHNTRECSAEMLEVAAGGSGKVTQGAGNPITKSEYSSLRKKTPSDVRNNMLELESSARAALQKAIEERLKR